ncbi:MAG: hypothetical protein QOH47_832 [Sphingomonadales bacterium]|jgi:hypothetical protein|nr:hypothetical protein [Sphingomonadales bacterium]
MSSLEKKCPRCAEMVKAEAIVCRFCGHEFSVARPGAPIHRSRTMSGCGLSLLIAVALIVIAGLTGPENGAMGPAAAPEAARDPGPCDAAVSRARADGLIRRERGNRIEVEDTSWSMASADGKRGLMLLFLCSHLRGRAPSGLNDYVVAYGYRSGRRVAMASDLGVTFE